MSKKQAKLPNIQNPTSCFFCGEIYGSIMEHQSVCPYRDKNFSSKCGALENTKQIIKSSQLGCLFVLVPVCDKVNFLVQMYYQLLKSMNPSLLVVTVPFRRTITMTLHHLMLSEWYTKLKDLKFFLIFLNVERSFKHSKINDHIKDINGFDKIEGVHSVLFDNWCYLETSVELISEAAQLEDDCQFDIGEYSQVIIGKNFIKRVEKLKKILLHLKLIAADEKQHIFGPSYFIPSKSNVTSFDCDTKQKSKKKKLMFCSMIRYSNICVLGDDLFCDFCQKHHSLRQSLTSCKYCSQKFMYGNLSRHEKNCMYSFADIKDPSAILLLISIGTDGEIRSNLFGQFMKLYDVVDQNTNFMITRIHLDDLAQLNQSILSSKANILSSNSKDAKVVVFTFCGYRDALEIASKQLINTNIIPHLSTVNLSIRIQISEITKTFFNGIQFPPGYNFSIVTSNFRFFQMMTVYRTLVTKSDECLDLIKALKTKLGIVPSFNILPFFREWYSINKSNIFSQFSDTIGIIKFDILASMMFPNNEPKKQIPNLISLLQSFGIYIEKEGIVNFHCNLEQMLSCSLPLFEKNMLKDEHSQKKVSIILNQIESDLYNAQENNQLGENF